MPYLTLALTILAGWFTWTFGEYVLHRFGMHQLRGKGIASREHLKHHAVRDSVLEKWALSWAGVILVGIGLGFLVAPTYGFGWVAGYGFYDWNHYWAHRRAPRNRYQTWLRRHHFHHHFGHPMANHCVTWPVWDVVFGTYERPEQVKVPRRMAMVWLCDDDGAVKPEFAADYALAGRKVRDEAQAEADLVAAFSNQAPSLA